MRKKRLITLISIVVLFLVTLICYYKQITPRTFGSSMFPLEEKVNYCVGENIREISGGSGSELLVLTDNYLTRYMVDLDRPIWKVSIKKPMEAFPPVSVGERVFVTDNEDLWALDLETGKDLWKVSFGSVSTWIPDVSDEFVLLNSVSSNVDVYKAESGKKLWSIPGGRGYTPAFIDQDKVYVIDRGVKAFNIYTGMLIWQINNERATGLGAFYEGILYYTEYLNNQTFDLVAYNTEIKDEIWRKNFVDNNLRELYIYNEFVYLAENNALYQLNSYDGEITWKKKLSDPASLSFMDKHIYVVEKFRKIIHVLDIESGNDIAALQISIPQIIGSDTREMIVTDMNLVFSRGCEIFVYGNELAQ